MKHSFKKIFLPLLGVAAFCSCTNDSIDWVEKCDRGDVYKAHNYNTYIYSADKYNNYTHHCVNCGLEYKDFRHKTYPKHYGTVSLYKNPKTGNFDTYVLTYVDESGEHFIKIDEKDLVKNTQYKY